MCRTTDFLGLLPDKDSINIKAFFIRFSGLNSSKTLPECLTLLVNGSKVRPDTPAAFMTLHRMVNTKTKKGEAIFGSREPVWARGVVQFEVYAGDETILKGRFNKDDGEKWKMESECGLGNEVFLGCCAADVAVAVDGQMAVLSRRVEMVLKRKKSNKRRGGGFDRLEVIPEEREEVSDDGDESVSGSDDGDDLAEGCGPDCDMDLDLDGVKWAVDLGIWVMCFGVGYLVSKASARSLRRLRLF